MLAKTFDDVIEIRIWRDPVVERVGFDACGDYVELFWLPIIGPTSTWLLRRLATTAVLHPHGCPIACSALASTIGLGSDIGPRSSLFRSIQRLDLFGLAQAAKGLIAVRTTVPPLTMKQLSRLPEHLQIAHALWSESDPSHAYDAAYPNSAPGSAVPELTSSAS